MVPRSHSNASLASAYCFLVMKWTGDSGMKKMRTTHSRHITWVRI